MNPCFTHLAFNNFFKCHFKTATCLVAEVNLGQFLKRDSGFSVTRGVTSLCVAASYKTSKTVKNRANEAKLNLLVPIVCILNGIKNQALMPMLDTKLSANSFKCLNQIRPSYQRL